MNQIQSTLAQTLYPYYVNKEVKMKRWMLVFLLAVMSVPAWSYVSGIAVQTEKGVSMQVFVNGKLCNKSPGKFVRVRSSPGLFRVEVKVLNPWNKQWYVVHKNVQIDKGYDFYYKVVFINKGKPELREVKRYPIYSRYFLNPSLYNQHPIS